MLNRSKEEQKALNELLVKNVMAGIHTAVVACHANGAVLTDCKSNDGNEEPVLVIAARLGFIDTALYLLQNGADVNSKDKKSTTAIHAASTAGHEQMVALLLQHKANAELSNGKTTPLEVARQNRHQSICKMLEQYALANRALVYNAAIGFIPGITASLEKGANINFFCFYSQGNVNGNALYYAALLDDKVTLQFLVDNGADVNAVNPDGATALHLAAKANDVIAVERLIISGADLDKATYKRSKKTPITVAAENGSLDALKAMVACKGGFVSANIDKNILVQVIENPEIDESDMIETIVWLIEQGASMTETNDDTQAPIHVAARLGYKLVIETLVKHGADYRLPRVTNGWGQPTSALAFAKDFRRQNIVTMLEKLYSQQLDLDLQLMINIQASDTAKVTMCLAKKANIHFFDANYGPALNEAAFVGSAEIIEMLVAAGANVESESSSGSAKSCKPLYLAAGNGHLAAVKSLLKAGARVNAGNENFGLTALLFAACRGHTNVVELLLTQQGVEVNPVSDENAYTPLHYAAKADNTKMAELLLAKETCKLFAKDNKRLTPLMLCFADGKNNIATAKVIIQALAFRVTDDNIGRSLEEIDCISAARVELMSHFIFAWQLNLNCESKKVSPRCKEIFITHMKSKYYGKDRATIKESLWLQSQASAAPAERRELCNAALDVTQSSPLSIMLNIKRMSITNDCSADTGTLSKFANMLREMDPKPVTKTKTKSIYDSQTIADLKASTMSAIETRSAVMIENTLEVLNELFQQESHPMIQAMILDLQKASRQEMVAPTAPPLLSVNPNAVQTPGNFGVFGSVATPPSSQRASHIPGTRYG